MTKDNIIEQITIDEVITAIKSDNVRTEVKAEPFIITITLISKYVKSVHIFNEDTQRFIDLNAKKYIYITKQIKRFAEVSGYRSNSIPYLKVSMLEGATEPEAVPTEATTTVYGYARCSTDETKQDIGRQERELKALGVSKSNIYWEYESGSNANREQLNRLLDTVKSGDTIISTEVSRITRSTKQLCEIIELAKEKKIKIVLGTFIVDCTKELDPMTEGMLKMMGVFSELERNMISQRVKSGMANAKAKGKNIGRPSGATIPKKFMEHYELYKDGKLTKTDINKLTGISRVTINKYINILENK